HRRKIEGGNARTDAERLAAGHSVDLICHLRQGFSLGEFGDAAGELDDLDSPAEIPAGFIASLPVLTHNARGQLLEMLLEKRLVTEQDRGSLGSRERRPGTEGLAGGGHRCIHFLSAVERYLGDDLAGAWVVNRGERLQFGRVGGGFAADRSLKEH